MNYLIFVLTQLQILTLFCSNHFNFKLGLNFACYNNLNCSDICAEITPNSDPLFPNYLDFKLNLNFDRFYKLIFVLP